MIHDYQSNMSAPKKNNADHFPHLVSHGKTISILQQRFGNDGYAVWFKTLEIVTGEEKHYYDCNEKLNWEWLVSEMMVTDEQLKNIYTLLADIGALSESHWKEGYIWVSKLKKYLAPLYRRRTENFPDPPELSNNSDDEQPQENKESTNKTTPSKSNTNKTTRTSGSLSEKSGTNKTTSSTQTVNKKTVKKLVDYWNKQNDTNLRPTDRKRTQVDRRLDTFSEKELMTAIKNRAADDWVQQQGQASNWDAMFRNDDKIDHWLNRTPAEEDEQEEQFTEALSLAEAKQFCKKKRLDFDKSLFDPVTQNGETKYVPTV